MLSALPPPDKPIQGNAAKFLSFREAWARISASRQAGFFLEAVTLEESIIADRVMTYLTETAEAGSSPPGGKCPGLCSLIRAWKERHPAPITEKNFADLPVAVDAWRPLRNHVVHGMVKSRPGEPTMPVEDFLEQARQAAEQGNQLARALSNWCRKAKRAFQRTCAPRA
jgi:hypothetical protein